MPAESGAIKAFASMINKNYCFVSSNVANEIFCEELYVVFTYWLILLTFLNIFQGIRKGHRMLDLAIDEGTDLRMDCWILPVDIVC